MGRKGVSKRKEKKTKPVISDSSTGSSVSSIVHASENKTVKSFDTSKDSTFLSDNKKKSKKK
jgi:hypothetical protein